MAHLAREIEGGVRDLTAGRRPEERLVVGPRGGVITTATLRDATGWDALVTELGQPGLVRHGLRHTALTWMADASIDLHILQRVAGHQDPAVTARYLHPDVQAMLKAGTAFSAWWSVAAVAGRYRRRQEYRLNTGPTRSDGVHRFGRAGEI